MAVLLVPKRDLVLCHGGIAGALMNLVTITDWTAALILVIVLILMIVDLRCLSIMCSVLILGVSFLGRVLIGGEVSFLRRILIPCRVHGIIWVWRGTPVAI